MDECLKECLIGGGVLQSVIAILEDQQLTNRDLLEDVEMNVLVLCSIKVGQAIKIKRVSKTLSSVVNDVKVKVKQEEPSTFYQQLVEHTYVDLEDSSEEIIENTAATTTKEIKGLSSVTKSLLQFQERRNIKFFDNFKLLDKFSPAVSACLENKCLSGNERNEFVRDVCTNIIANGIYYLSKAERSKVAMEIVTNYPFLKDPIGSGLGSWSESIRKRFKHVRKYSRKRQAATDIGSPANNTGSLATPADCKPKITRRMDFWNVFPSTQNSTDDIQSEHLSELIKETQRPKRNQDMGKIVN